MIDDKYVLLYSEEYKDLVEVLPTYSVKVLVDKEIAVVFRATVLPTLIVYKGTEEKDRVLGTRKIKDYLNERVDT